MSGKTKPPSSGRVSSGRVLVIAGLVIFIAVDIILVALALGWGRGEPHTAKLASPTQSTGPVEDSDGIDDAEPLPDADAETSRIAPRLLSVVSDAVAWRSEGGPCDERGALELTVDAGETWGAAYPSSDALGRPLWISGDGYTTVQSAVASGAECEPQGIRTFDSGASWFQEGQVIADSVFVDPSDTSLLLWGGETIEGPCKEMTQVSVTGGAASVVCGDGSLWSVASASSEWIQPGVEGAVAISGSDGRWIAAVESVDCDGLGLVEFNDAYSESLACMPVATGHETALDLSGNTLWVWAGGQVLVSTDLGRSLNR